MLFLSVVLSRSISACREKEKLFGSIMFEISGTQGLHSQITSMPIVIVIVIVIVLYPIKMIAYKGFELFSC